MAMICFSVEIIGLLLVGVALMPWMAKIGVLLAGAGFSLVFPALGVVAVKAVPQQNQGAALATYTVFMDLSLGVTWAAGGAADDLGGRAGYLSGGGGSGGDCAVADLAVKKTASGGIAGGRVIVLTVTG